MNSFCRNGFCVNICVYLSINACVYLRVSLRIYHFDSCHTLIAANHIIFATTVVGINLCCLSHFQGQYFLRKREGCRRHINTQLDSGGLSCLRVGYSNGGRASFSRCDIDFIVFYIDLSHRFFVNLHCITATT